MKKTLSEQHDREWEAYLVQHNQVLKDLIEMELATRKKFGMQDDQLPEITRNELEHARQAFTETWSAKGSEVAHLTARQQAEIEEAEMDAMYAFHTGEEDMPDTERLEAQIEEYENTKEHNPDETDTMYADLRAAEKLRRHIMAQKVLEEHPTIKKDAELESFLEDYGNLIDETNAIADWYYYCTPGDIPHATKQRMSQHLKALTHEMKGQQSNMPSGVLRTMNDEELNNEVKSYKELIDQHEIISHHYERHKEIPLATRIRMAKDEEQFWKELNAHQAVLKRQQKENIQLIGSRDEFKDQLKAIRERNEQAVHRPKPG